MNIHETNDHHLQIPQTGLCQFVSPTANERADGVASARKSENTVKGRRGVIDIESHVLTTLAAASATKSPSLHDDSISGGIYSHSSCTSEKRHDKLKFPEKLMLILYRHDAENAIVWNEKGDRWKVLNIRKLEMLLPKYFKHRCYKSFMRQVNIYGFKRIRTGPDAGSYFHPDFQRKKPKLCIKMHAKRTIPKPMYQPVANHCVQNSRTPISSSYHLNSARGLNCIETHDNLAAVCNVCHLGSATWSNRMQGNTTLRQLPATSNHSVNSTPPVCYKILHAVHPSSSQRSLTYDAMGNICHVFDTRPVMLVNDHVNHESHLFPNYPLTNIHGDILY